MYLCAKLIPTIQKISMKMRFLLFFAFLNSFITLAQTGTISGTVKFENKENAIGASVFLEGTQKSAIADENGNFVFKEIPFGKYTLAIQSLDAEKKTIAIDLNATSLKVSVTLEKKGSQELKEVVIKKESIKKQIEEKGFAVNVIETKEAGLRNIQTNELLDRTVGIRIRQNGGLGSEVNYNINGMSGNSIRIFIDGIPITTYGSSFDLNSIPPSMIERIEVYKGVVPGHLADDALGGAINVILKKGAKNNFNASASYGSFNTTQLSFNGLYRFDKSGLTFKASGFYNYSDNDYRVWGPKVYNIRPNGSKDYDIRPKRFNDAFKSIGGVVEIGFTDVKWADNFFIGYTGSDLYKEIQHGTFMTTPYNGRFTESDANLFSLTYNKKNILVDGLEFNLHGLIGERNRLISDTDRWNYNWTGERSLNLYGQEFMRPGGAAQQGSPTLANIKRKVTSLRAGLSYAINDNHKFFVNSMFSSVGREDDDEMKSVLERNFFGTRDLQKNITSATYELLAFEKKLKTSVFGKSYHQKIERMNPTAVVVDGVPTRVENVVESTTDKNGYGLAVSYTIVPTVTVLTSAEKGVRLPNENEVFGDAGDNIVENPNIRPETSNNINLGFKLGPFKYYNHEISIASNGFYRNIKDRIGPQVQSRLNDNLQVLPFENQGNAKSKGVDVELNYTLKGNLNILLSASKFDLRYKNMLNERKIPNEPTFTANASAQYSFKDLLWKNSRLNLYYNFMFVDTFNYMLSPYAGNAGTDDFDVPQQIIQDAGLSYVFPNKKFIVSFDAKNIFNKMAFDNFAVQKPGRAFFIKLNYVINNF